MVATHLFVKADGSSSSVAKFKALTDNQGNAKMALKNLTSKMPLAAVYMQWVLHLAAKDVEMGLEWLSRDDNVPADAISNGYFELFSPELRIMVKLEDLDISLMMKLIDSWGEVEEMVKKGSWSWRKLRGPRRTTGRGGRPGRRGHRGGDRAADREHLKEGDSLCLFRG
jgi:hypothetical protein